MSAFLIQNMAPLMFASLIVVMLIGYPVAFALAATGIFFGLVGVELGLLSPALFQALPQRMWAVMSNDTLLAATTGVVAASVISMGLISLPIMLRYGYGRRFASGVIAASGTLAQIIPPSLVLIVMADQLGKSVGDMYAGAFIPGIPLAGLYAVYAAGIAFFRPGWAPALPLEARTFREPNGSSGTPSLIILVIIAVIASVAFAHWHYPQPDPPLDELLVLATAVGVGVAFFASVINHVTKLCLLS